MIFTVHPSSSSFHFFPSLYPSFVHIKTYKENPLSSRWTRKIAHRRTLPRTSSHHWYSSLFDVAFELIWDNYVKYNRISGVLMPDKFHKECQIFYFFSFHHSLVSNWIYFPVGQQQFYDTIIAITEKCE